MWQQGVGFLHVCRVASGAPLAMQFQQATKALLLQQIFPTMRGGFFVIRDSVPVTEQ